MGLPAGIRFGPYEVVELLGAGGMGEVYRAHDRRLGRDVALKVLPDRFARSPDRLRRFEREARLAGALNHPNILTVFDIGSQDGSPYLVCELLEGETLHARLRFERMDVRQALYLALQVARGLGCAHEAGILHRDLKPSNLFLTRDGRLKILDFGLAKLVQAGNGTAPEARTSTHDTDAGRAAGTAAYMSPEQIRDEPLDARCDIFALGAVLYESLAQRPPFVGATDSDVMASILRDEPPPLATLAPAVPSGVEAMVRRCLEKRREERFGSAREVSAALHAIIESFAPGHAFMDGSDELAVKPVQLRRRSGPSAPTLIAPRRHRISRAGIAAGVAVSALIGAALLARSRTTAPTAAPAPSSLAVMYFENLSDRADADNLGRMLAALVTTELASSHGMQVVSSQRLSDIARQLGKAEGAADRAIATDVARRAGAATMVLGQVMRAGPRMMATAELVDVAGGHRLGSYRAEGTAAQDVFAMAAGLGSQVRMRLTGRQSQSGAVPLTRQLTTSVDAYRAYVRGETLVHRWEWEKAADAFRQAVSLDPEFALAHYRLGMALSRWGTFGPEGRAAVERAAALKDKLPPREREVVAGAALVYAGRRSAAVPVLEAILARDPDNKELLYLLSECYMHSPREADPRRAAELMERLLVLDPDFHLVYHQLAVAYVILGDFATAHERLDGWEAKEPESIRHIRAMVSFYQGRIDEALRLSESPHAPLTTLWRCVYALAAGRWDIVRGIISEQERQAELARQGGPSRPVAPYMDGMASLLQLFHGEFDAAEASLKKTASGFRFEPNEGEAAGFLTLHRLADLLALKGDVHGAQREAEKALLIQPDGPYCLYVAGVFALRASDMSAAERHLRKLEEVVTASRGPLVPHYRDALVAEIALARGRPSDARPLLESAVQSGKLHYDFWASCATAARFRDGLARTYLALGEKQKAARVLEALVASQYDIVAAPLPCIQGLHSLGRLELELGERARGREHLRKFLEYWAKAQWDLPQVGDARARLASSS